MNLIDFDGFLYTNTVILDFLVNKSTFILRPGGLYEPISINLFRDL